MNVYCLTNTITKKCYIGQTTKSVQERLAGHIRHPTYRTSAIASALRKYGRETFNVEILQECQSQDELDEAEASWIKKKNSIAPNGYNLRSGGKRGLLHPSSIAILSAKAKLRGSNPVTIAKMAAFNRGRKKSPEQIARMRVYLKGRKMPPGWRENLSKACMGRITSPETRAKLSVAALGKKRPGTGLRGARNHKAKLTDEAVRKIRAMYVRGKTKQWDIAKQFGVCQAVVSKVLLNKTWVDVKNEPSVEGSEVIRKVDALNPALQAPSSAREQPSNKPNFH